MKNSPVVQISVAMIAARAKVQEGRVQESQRGVGGQAQARHESANQDQRDYLALHPVAADIAALHRHQPLGPVVGARQSPQPVQPEIPQHDTSIKGAQSERQGERAGSDLHGGKQGGRVFQDEGAGDDGRALERFDPRRDG